MAVPLLKYPTKWGASIKCTSETFDLPKCDYKCEGPELRLCTCHERCEQHCEARRTYLNLFVGNWYQVLAPYSNLSACDVWSHQVVSDAVLKLNALDPDQGLNALQALMIIKDDASLCKKFLELGVNPDAPFVPMASEVRELLTKQGRLKAALEVPSVLAGGTAVHFAAYFGRQECLEAMLAVGTDLSAKTNDGLTPRQVTQEASDGGPGRLRSMLSAAENDSTAHSLPALAKSAKWHAMRYRMRTGKAKLSELTESVDGKTSLEWVWHHMTSWQFSMMLDEDSLAAFKIMSEMKYRYGLDSTSIRCDIPVIGRSNREQENPTSTCHCDLIFEAVQLLKEEIAEMSAQFGSYQRTKQQDLHPRR